MPKRKYRCENCKRFYFRKEYYVKGKICKDCLIKEAKKCIKRTSKLLKELALFYLVLKSGVG